MGEHKRLRRTKEPGALRYALKEGALLGGIFAALYSAYAIGLFVVLGSAPFERNGTTLGVVLISYVACGLAAGAVFGASYRLRRQFVGQFVVGVILAMIVFFGISIAADGVKSAFTPRSLTQVLALGVFFGVSCTIAVRRL